MTGTATYLYAITRSIGPPDLTDTHGVADAPVRALSADDLACIVSTVDLAEFGEDALRSNLEDLGWLERIARQHDSVVQFLARQVTTVPLRLATICRDDSSALSRLEGMREQARTVLADIDGREEWGVKIFDMPAEPTAAAQPVGAPTGSAYLRQRRDELAARARSAQAAARDADAEYDRLARLVADARRHRPQDPQLTGIAAPMVLNAAFLVERRDVNTFRAEVAELAAQRPAGAVALTGPWPPYSFVSLDDERGTSDDV
jgi:hypothetical protein